MLAVHKKKVEDFAEFMAQRTARFLVLIGPPGSGKNAMIGAYATQHQKRLVRHVDSRPLACTEFLGRYSSASVDEVEQLSNFIKRNAENTR